MEDKNKNQSLITKVANYYSDRLAQHGATPKGVDWNGDKSQLLRFEQLSKIIKPDQHFSINDLGSGYGALYAYLVTKFTKDKFSYSGIDVSENMIAAAKKRFQQSDQVQFITSTKPEAIADYTIASGIFSVKLGHESDQWLDYIKMTLKIMDRYSTKGFSFNCLTCYSDAHLMKDNLYYADPSEIFDFCKKKFSRNIALLHDYDLYEFTILVRK